MVSPTSSNSSVGKGPDPTRVVYALKIPKTSFTLLGAIPKPVQAPAAVVVDEVTNGYVPKSISSNDPCAPSARIDFPSLRRSEEHTSELQSRENLVCRLL